MFFVNQSRRASVWVYLWISSDYWMKCIVYLDEGICMRYLKRQIIITKNTLALGWYVLHVGK